MHRHTTVLFSTLEWEDEEAEEQSRIAAIPDTDPLPEEVVETNDQYGSLHQAIAALPPKFRSIDLHRDWAPASHAHIDRQDLLLPLATASTQSIGA